MAVIFSLKLDASGVLSSANSASDALNKVAQSAETARKTVGQVSSGAGKALGEVSGGVVKVSQNFNTVHSSLADVSGAMGTFLNTAKGLTFIESTMGAINRLTDPALQQQYGKAVLSTADATERLGDFTRKTSSLEAELSGDRDVYWAKRKEQMLAELGYSTDHINAAAMLSATEERVRVERLKEESNNTQSYAKLWEETYKRVDEAGADMIEGFLTGSKNGLDSLKTMFTRTLAEMANAALLRPITVSVMGVLGGAMGMPDTAQAIGTASTGASLSGASSLTSFLPKSWTTGISSFMSTPLPGTFIPGLMGPTPSGAALHSGFGLGSVLGYGAAGGLGYSLLGGALGLPQNKYTGITSGLGGAAGSYAGSALSSALGMAGSVAFPIVGTILGALGGGLLGGLFGSERKTKPSVYTKALDLGIDADIDYEAAFRSGAWYDRAGEKEAAVVMPVLGETAKQTAAQIEALTAALPEEYRQQVEAELGKVSWSAGRGVAGMDKSNWNFQFYNEDQLKERLAAATSDIQKAMGKAAEEALGNVDMSGLGLTLNTGTLEGLAKATKALEAFRNASETIDVALNPLSEYEQVQQGINAQMDQWVASLRELGFTQEKVAEIESQRAAMLEAALGPLKLAFEQDLRLRLAQIGGNQNVVASTQLAIQHERELAEIRSKFGESSMQYEQTLMVQSAERHLLEIEQQRQAILAAQQAVAAAEVAYQRAQSAVQSAAQSWVSGAEAAFRQARNDYATEVRSVVEANKTLANSLKALRKDLYMDARLNPQGVTGALATAQSEFDRLYEQGMAGDADAASQLGGVAKKLAELLYGSSSDFGTYQDAFYGITQKLAEVESAAQKKADEAHRQLDALLGIESTGKKTMEQLKADMEAARKQYDEALTTTKRYYSLWGLDQLNPSISGLKAQFFQSLKGLESAEQDLNVALQSTIELTGGKTVGSLEQLRSAAQIGLERQLNMLAMIELAIREMATKGSSSAEFQQLVLQAKAYDLNAQGYGGRNNWTPADIMQVITGYGVTFEYWYQKFGQLEGLGGGQLPTHPGNTGGSTGGSGSAVGGSTGGGTGTPPAVTPPTSNYLGSKYPTLNHLLAAKAASLNAQRYDGKNDWNIVSTHDALVRIAGSVENWYRLAGKAEGFAKGGLASAGWAMVGEEGPELVNFSHPGRVYNAKDTADMFQAAASPASRDRGSSDITAELRAMRQEIGQLRRENAYLQRQLIKAVNQVAQYTGRTSVHMEEVMDEGLKVHQRK